jgi:hypothetical protein
VFVVGAEQHFVMAVAVVGDSDQHLNPWVAVGAAQTSRAIRACASGGYLGDDCEWQRYGHHEGP